MPPLIAFGKGTICFVKKIAESMYIVFNCNQRYSLVFENLSVRLMHYTAEGMKPLFDSLDVGTVMDTVHLDNVT